MNDYDDECTCDTEHHDPHLCPYAEDVYNEERECNCCPSCYRKCLDDI